MDSTLPLKIALTTLNLSFLFKPSAAPPYQLKFFLIKAHPFPIQLFRFDRSLPLKKLSFCDQTLPF